MKIFKCPIVEKSSMLFGMKWAMESKDQMAGIVNKNILQEPNQYTREEASSETKSSNISIKKMKQEAQKM